MNSTQTKTNQQRQTIAYLLFSRKMNFLNLKTTRMLKIRLTVARIFKKRHSFKTKRC